MKHLKLKKDTILKQGDEFYSPTSTNWYKTKNAGLRVGMSPKTDWIYRRPIKTKKSSNKFRVELDENMHGWIQLTNKKEKGSKLIQLNFAH